MRRDSGLSAACQGDDVIAQDGLLGRVDRVVDAETPGGPAYLVVAVGTFVRRKYPVLPAALVTTVDRSCSHVHVRGRRKALEHLPESLPLVH